MMHNLMVSPLAVELLRKAGIEEDELQWDAPRPAVLGITTAMECEGLMARDLSAVIVLAKDDDEPPAILRTAGIASAVVFTPVSDRELQRQISWLARALENHDDGYPTEQEHTLHRLAQAGRIAATVSHEMGNALSYASTNVEYLAQMLGQARLTDPDYASAAQQAGEGIQLALSIGRLVLELSRGNGPAARPVDVNEVIERTLRVSKVRAPRSTRFEVELSVLPPAMADPTALLQVVMNLVLNATDAAGPRGRISIRSEYSGGQVVISVGDSGPGISPEVAPRLFQPFASGKRGGTGLGLTVSRTLVESLGGTLEVGSSALGGAEFRVVLRVAPIEIRHGDAGRTV